MSQKQYLKMLEREIRKINRKIDEKILRGEEYKREAHDHKLMLRRLRYLTRQNPFKTFTNKFSFLTSIFF